LVKDIYSEIVGQDEVADPVEIVRKCLRTPLLVPESQQVSKLFEIMRRDRIHLAIVMDEYGSFSGVVTMEDMLEEIVGEISDELDFDDSDVVATWLVDHWETNGSVSMTDFSRTTGTALESIPDTNTLNGLFMKQLDRMPKQGDEIECFGFKFIAIDEEGNRIGRIEVYPAQVTADEIEDYVPNNGPELG